MKSAHKIQIAIAIIGLISAISVAIIANWDKLFPHKVKYPPIVQGSQSENTKSAQTKTTTFIYTPKQFDGRVGEIFVKNTSLYPFKMTLWHPDSESKFRSWVINGTSKKYLSVNGSAISIGNDWGIQIGDSEVKSVDDTSTWTNSEWRVSQNTFFK